MEDVNFLLFTTKYFGPAKWQTQFQNLIVCYHGPLVNAALVNKESLAL